MRKITLSPNDFSLFGHEISPNDYEYFIKHKDAFRRMWNEQGQKFWLVFLMTFKKFAKKNILLSPLPQLGEDVRSLSDIVFRGIVSDFTLGKQTHAKRLIDDIINVARNRHSIQYLESKSLAKDPFYHKETRDAFRNLFGEPNHRITYAKVYLYMVMYLKFGGSVMECLRLWLKAEEWSPDLSWYVPHFQPGEFDLGIDGYIMYLLEKNHGSEKEPLYLDNNWTLGNPRLYQHDKNPLYDEGWKEKDWRADLSLGLFEKFLVFFMQFRCSVCQDNACCECKRLKEDLDPPPVQKEPTPEPCTHCDQSKKVAVKEQNRVEALKILEKRAKAVSILKDLSPRALANVKDCLLGPELEIYDDEDFDDYEESLDSELEIASSMENLDTAIDILLNPPTATNLPKLKLSSLSPPRGEGGELVVAPTSGERGELDQAVVTKNQVTKSVSDIADIVNDMAERVSDVVTRVNSFAEKTKDDEGFKARSTVEELQDSVERAKAAVGKAQGSVGKSETVDQAKSALMDAIEAMKTANDLTGKAADTVEKWRDYIDSAQDVVGKATQTIEKTEDTIRQTKDTIEKTRDQMLRTRQQIEQSKLANDLIQEYVIPLSDEELVSALFGQEEPSRPRAKSTRSEKKINDQHRQYLDEGLRSMLPTGLIPDSQLIVDASLPLSDRDIGRTVSIATEDRNTRERLVYTITFPKCSDLGPATVDGVPPEATVHVSKDVDLFNKRDDWTRASDCFPAVDTTASLEASLKENWSINERIRQRVLTEVNKKTSLTPEMRDTLIEQVERQVFQEVVQHAREEMAAQSRKRHKRKKPAKSLRKCWHCDKEEIVYKEFKKCQMCKDVGAKDARYYCGKECQVLDWKARHRREHADKAV